MSKQELQELQELVGGFRKTLTELVRMGCQDASMEVCAPPVPLPEAIVSSTLISDHGLQSVREELGDCQRCVLSETRSNIVFGSGSEDAQLMFVGEAPGAEEDRAGEPFVGPAGLLLDKMIVAMGWQRETVYLANVLKCRPPQGREPRIDEVATCQGFLAKQVASVAPRVIVALGEPAAHALLGTNASETSLCGIWQTYRGIAVMPTYHPADLLLDPSKKRETWAHLQEVMQRLAELA